jgi:hypothetical protein
MTEANERVRPAVFDLSLAVEALDKASLDFDSLTVDEAVEALSVVKELIGRQRQLEAALERWVAECFKAEGWRDPQEFPGLGLVEVRRSKNRRAWDHDSLARDWLNTYMEGRGGEAPDPFDVVADFRKVAGIGSWKVTGLREYGIDAADYCDESPGTPTVSIVRSES